MSSTAFWKPALRMNLSTICAETQSSAAVAFTRSACGLLCPKEAPQGRFSRKREIGFALLLAVALFLGAAPAFAAAKACNAPAAPLLTVNKVRGIRTKWASVARDRRNTIEPDLAHLTLKTWMKDLEAIGVNLAELNLEPERKLAEQSTLTQPQLQAALDAIYTPKSARTPTESGRVSAFENDIVPNWRYTAKQRDDVQLDFLRRLEKLRQAGEIAGTVRFILHQRLWFRAGNRPRRVYTRQRHVAEFADDMARFIRRADEDCLGHWIAGIRLGEHSNRNMNELLPLIVDLARAVNARTDGWLKSHLFVVNGGGWGAEYRGISHLVGPDGNPFPFFHDIAAETGAFSFGYKFMQFHDRYARGIVGHMAIAHCTPRRDCDPASVSDWEEYLGGILGFNELVAYLKANHNRYPADANVVFTGDSSDAVTEMVEPEPDGQLKERPSLIALRHLFAQAGSVAASGKIFMNGFSTAANIRNYAPGGPVDIGRALYFVSASGKAQLLPHSERIWKDWPGE